MSFPEKFVVNPSETGDLLFGNICNALEHSAIVISIAIFLNTAHSHYQPLIKLISMNLHAFIGVF